MSKSIEDFKITVNTYSDIQEAIKPFLPSVGDEEETVILQTNIDSMKGMDFKDKSATEAKLGTVIRAELKKPNVRRILLEGIKMIENRMKYDEEKQQKAEDADFGGFMPVVEFGKDHLTWVDVMVKQCLGGERVGTKVVWRLDEGTFQFDPKSGKLERI